MYTILTTNRHSDVTSKIVCHDEKVARKIYNGISSAQDKVELLVISEDYCYTLDKK